MITVTEMELQKFQSHEALGKLVAVEGGKEIPIPIKRVFYVFGAREDVVRGKHAHRECTQVLVCVNGSCEVICDDGTDRKTFMMSNPEEFLVIPPGIWASERYVTKDTVLMVFCDMPYNSKEYIRHYDQFIEFRNNSVVPLEKAA